MYILLEVCMYLCYIYLLSLGGDLLREFARGADDERRHALAVTSLGCPLNRGDQERYGFARAGFCLRQDVNACIIVWWAHGCCWCCNCNKKLPIFACSFCLRLQLLPLSHTVYRLLEEATASSLAKGRRLWFCCSSSTSGCSRVFDQASEHVGRCRSKLHNVSTVDGLPTCEADTGATTDFVCCREYDLENLDFL